MSDLERRVQRLEDRNRQQLRKYPLSAGGGYPVYRIIGGQTLTGGYAGIERLAGTLGTIADVTLPANDGSFDPTDEADALTLAYPTGLGVGYIIGTLKFFWIICDARSATSDWLFGNDFVAVTKESVTTSTSSVSASIGYVI